MEEYLQNVGGTFKPDFGFEDTLSFSNQPMGWNKVLDMIAG
jgi:hypothetical protein